MINKIYEKYNGITDEQWLDVLFDSIRNNKIDGLTFPGFPDKQTQINFVGNANKNTLKEIWPYYQQIRKAARENGVVFDKNTRLLDVGSGWGRVIRFFLKDILPENLHGMDTMQTSVDLCNEYFGNAINFSIINMMPPTDFNDNWFDIIEGYSVVSHLSRHSGLMWLDEYYRILKPGGILALTVWKQARFEFITESQKTMDTSEGHPKLISQIYTPGCVIERKIFNALGFDYKSYAHGGIEGNEDITYGEAIMSADYIKKYWCRYFDFIDYVDAPELAQALVVLKKPAESESSSRIDTVRQEQYDLLKQMDLINGITIEMAAATHDVAIENTAPNEDINQFTPAFGYKKLVANHAKAAIKAFKTGLLRKFGSP